MSQGQGTKLACLVGLGAASVVLSGAAGMFYVNNGAGSRYSSVPYRNSTPSFWGYSDVSTDPACVYQQKKDSTMAVLACGYPDTQFGYTDACGVTWYPYNFWVSLNAGDDYWFGTHDPAAGKYEYTQIFVSRNSSSSGLVTFPDDWQSGRSKYPSTCFRSLLKTNGSVTPIILFRGGMPAGQSCSGSVRSFAACPSTCSLPSGCDFSLGSTQDEFYLASRRVNSSNQDTSQTEFDHYAGLSGYTPGGNWYYGWESRACVGGTYNGLACTQNYNCAGGYCGAANYVVLRRDTYSGLDSLQIRRGESRRNVRIEAWSKNTGSGYYYRYTGLIGRFYNNDNYFAFRLTEYGSDSAWIDRVSTTIGHQTVAISYPSFNMNNNWTRLGFDIKDRGSYVDAGFVPSGNCYVAGLINGNPVVSAASTPCSFAPTGRSGVYNNASYGSQFWDLDATPLSPIVQ